MDDLASVKDAGGIVRKIQADRSSASLFLDKDPNVVAATLLADPATLETDIGAILKLLDTDDTGAARAGFQRAFFNEMLRRNLSDPSAAGRMPGEAVLDPSQINQLLTQNETALRQIFSDRAGPPGSNMTSYDMLKIFNDEVSLGMAERAGKAAGAASEAVELTFRGGDAIRNAGRIIGVKAASITGGPALGMAGTGGRLAGKIFESGGKQAIYSLVADALADPSLAKLLLTETASLSKKGKFVFDKRLTQALRPYQVMAGPPTQVIREGVQQQKEIDRIEREGGKTDIIFDPNEREYQRKRVGDQTSVQPVATPVRQYAAQRPPSRPPAAGSVLSQVSPVAPRPMAQASQQTMAGLSQLGMPLFAAHGGYITKPDAGKKNSGIMSVNCKPRQMVG